MNLSCLRESPNGVYLAVKIQPRASRNQIGPLLGNELKIALTAPPVDSAANEALVRFLAETLRCPRASVQITRGHTSRRKTLFVAGLRAAEVAPCLGLA